MKTACIIPARGGSKRIPKKNIRDFLGKPMIAYSIDAALTSKVFDQVIVSTDSEEIASIARQYGATTPFMRDSRLADDYTSTHEVIRDAASRLLAQNKDLEFVCCLYATAPLVSAEYLKIGLKEFATSTATMAYSVTAFDFPILRSVRVDENGLTQMFWPEYEKSRSQDLPKAYHDAGQFYWYRVKDLIEGKQMSFNGSLPVILPSHLVQDIDTEEDWRLAELKYRYAIEGSAVRS